MASVLILGGAGVFGGRLARLLLADGIDVIVAGRDERKAAAFCSRHGGRPARLDRDGDAASALAGLGPAVVVDAAGPFQDYGAAGYRFARAALESGAHYLDLADDAGFVSGIASLDGVARGRGLAALSGASSVPAISSAAADALCVGLARVAVIETAIMPGNRAPRGRSLVRAILGQAGRPLRLRRGGAWCHAPGWSGLARRTVTVPGVAPLDGRWTALIGAPDLALFPSRYGADSVVFRAGLELPVLHFGLAALAWLPRLGLVRSVAPLADLVRGLSDLLLPFGSDRGGMTVAVTGRDGRGQAVRRTWSLVVEAGEGPFVPALPALLLARKALAGTLAPGARPCLGELTLAEVERGLERIQARTARAATPGPPLYERVLGDRFGALPEPIRRLHDVHDIGRWRGRSSVVRGQHPLARLFASVFRLPATGEDVDVGVDLAVRGDGEVWTRRFGERRFRSRLDAAPEGSGARLTERFGPVRVALGLPADADGLAMPVVAASLFGVPLPRALIPISTTREHVDDGGRFRFDVDIALPWIGRLVAYRGWLEPAADDRPA